MAGTEKDTTDIFKFAVKPQVISCEQAIGKQAKHQQIRVIKANGPKLWLHFECPSRRWRRFYREIRHLCTIESPVTCTCPQWLQKVVLRNLHEAAQNDKVNPISGDKASQILAGLGG